MSSGSSNLTRRKFMLVSAAGIVAAPLLTNLSDLAHEAKAAEEVKTAKRDDAGEDNPKCKGCRMCTIFYSNCFTLNNRVCWCEPAGEELA